ncbi:MAG: 4Fe-4S dicluster domain-containing protein [Puniceicoccales bacterium]|jgi:molybdopterin-containing oxidoreductase family iron-sulfur binding subunit|nr:4Fe-4S dicluster domain-containing protein [Puniceicoccales bacterium]
MGASFGLAGLGLAGCREPRNHTLPYSKQPENSIPGIPVFYATSLPGASANEPLVVETHQHRPTKIEGNPSYRPTGYASSNFAQASVLDLYDPDRAQFSYGPKRRQLTRADVTASLKEIAAVAEKNQGEGLAFLAEPSTSPTRARLVAMLRKKYPKATWAEYTPIDDNAGDKALSQFFGKPVRALYDFSKAKRILSLEADFLGHGSDSLANTKGFSKGRKVASAKDAHKMNRLYAVESTFTLTGAAADHRLRVASSHIGAFVLKLYADLLLRLPKSDDRSYTLGILRHGLVLNTNDEVSRYLDKWISECVNDLIENKGASLVVAGAHLPPHVHELVAVINDRLGSVGKTLNYVAVPANDASPITELVKRPANTLVILGGNPVYNAPADLEWEKYQNSAKQVVRVGYHSPRFDETSTAAALHPNGLFISGTHYLESWSDGRTADGTYVPVQPMILPIFDGFQELDVLALLLGLASDSHTLVKETFKGIAANAGIDDAEAAFDAWLAEGVLNGTTYEKVAISMEAVVQANDRSTSNDIGSSVTLPLSRQSLEIRILPSPHTWDGRYANNGWLQEIPDPLLKTCWENVIAVSPKLAKELSIEPNPMTINKLGQLNRNINQLVDGKLQCFEATLTLDGKTIRGPVLIAPGLADYTVALTLGFGRRSVGRIGSRVSELENDGKIVGIGFDVYPFVTSTAPAVRTGVKLELTGEKIFLCSTQDHWSLEGRDIIREANATDYEKHPNFAQEMGIESHSPKIYGKDAGKSLQEKATTQPRGNSAYETPVFGKPFPNVDVWKNHEDQYPAIQQWGMSVDLNTCTGCNACVVACQSENNIPIVGRDQAMKGRSMHWIRMDRYFFDGRQPGETMHLPEDPQVTFMSMACTHCEMAPCESVCPVNATVHDQEGINVMAYNRCVGTRYCANNCPYKVRRFNFLDYSDRKIGHFYEGPLGPKGKPELVKMAMNPDVTVRMRGVMEKCTYCVQRIQQAKIHQKVEAKNSGDVHVPDGVIKTACQQVCAADAIVFGDISDAQSAVSKAKASDRTYSVLGYLNTRPRTTYQAKLRNPNPKMPGGAVSPLSRVEYDGKNHAVHAEHQVEDKN